MNPEQRRKQAKDLVRAARAGDREALERLGGRDTFVVASTDGRRARADALLAARPEIAADPWAALVLGHGFAGDVAAPGGPRDWPPLMYVCRSVHPTTALGRELLARGADPNATAEVDGHRLTVLCATVGDRHDPQLARALLQAGAEPDDNDSLYHAAYAPSPDCVRVLLEHGATVRGTNALGAAIDQDHVEHVRLMLQAGGDPHEGALVAHAVRRGASAAMVALLAGFGADVNRPGGETWRGNVPLRTPYQHAVLRGRDDLAAELERLGARTEVDPADAAVAAIARGHSGVAPIDPGALDPDPQEVLILTALRGSADLERVVDAVGPDFRGIVGGSPILPLLGHAAWVGDPGVVGALLTRGADPLARGDATFDTPLAIAALASRDNARPGCDHVAVAERLLAAGGELEPRFLDVADGPLADWLDQRIAAGQIS